ncbi:uncharacterized protein LOC128880256 [Hylaeus volcanicus]|uniref:uncharacterized protein LOC128880256 n=1 Tax=Hylaeus volcanicus TaxID=313075 RepID=UPI0023B843AC|nr:uncharacterized protein LOC128880256 [Hylaeus volcanicus]
MPPRKTARQAEEEAAEKIADPGDVLPPKRKKNVAKAAVKSDDERQIRLPRAAKSGKAQAEVQDAGKNPKTADKTIPKKSAPVMKANSKTKSVAAKKNKEAEVDVNEETGKEKVEAAKTTRTKAATKKAGMEADEDSKTKPKGKPKKASNKTTDGLDPPATKKRKQANTEPTVKESTSRGKSTRKKNETEANAKDEPAAASVKLAGRKTRGRKNDTSPEEEEVQNGDNENNENNVSESTESTQTSRKGKAAKKKEETAPQKKVAKPRGKAANRNNDNVATENDTSTAKEGKDVQKKAAKDNGSTPKKGRGKKLAVTDVNGENLENTFIKKGQSDSIDILASNNNLSKSSNEEDNKEDSDAEDVNHAKMQKSNDSFQIKTEENETNEISTSIHEEEN